MEMVCINRRKSGKKGQSKTKANAVEAARREIDQAQEPKKTPAVAIIL
jgi:hypothetical protein